VGIQQRRRSVARCFDIAVVAGENPVRGVAFEQGFVVLDVVHGIQLHVIRADGRKQLNHDRRISTPMMRKTTKVLIHQTAFELA
jgi:hypothetical protein